MIEVEGKEALGRCLPKLGARHAAIEVGIGRDHRLGQVEKPEASRALMALIFARGAPAAAPTTPMMVAATAPMAAFGTVSAAIAATAAVGV